MSLPLPPSPEPDSPHDAAVESPFKSRGGLQRVWRAAGYSWAGLRAAVRHEAAFRQELALGLPLLVLAWVLAPTRWQALALSASVVLVWLVELLNSALEALADAVSAEHRPLLGRAKDMASAAVMLALALSVATWAVVFWPDAG
jgi:diacylglycerol kinase (ATP)